MSQPFSSPSIWNEVSPGYQKYLMPTFQVFLHQALEGFEFQHDMRLLDLACGPGTVSLALQSEFSEIEGIDFSEQMIDRFRQEVSQRKIDHISPSVGNGEELSRYGEGRFDWAISLFGMIFFQDFQKSLESVWQTLKPGGRLLISAWPPLTESSCMMVGLRAIQSTQEDYPTPEPPPTGLHQPSFVMEAFEKAGFVDVQSRLLRQEFEVTDANRFWEEMVESSAHMALLRRNKSEDEWARLSEGAVEFLSRVLPQESPLSLVAFSVTGQKPL